MPYNRIPYSAFRTISRLLLVFLTFIVSGLAQTIPNHYTLILEDPPLLNRVVGRENLQRAEAVTVRQQIQAKQRSVRDQLDALNISVHGSADTVMNAIFVSASEDQVAALKSIPGVMAVVPVRRYKRSLNRALSLLDAPSAWGIVGGMANAGRGLKIAVLDDGIQQTHPMFQSPSLPVPSGFPKCAGTDCTFTNNKIIVARSYVRMLAAGSNPSNPAADSRPDDYSPSGRGGHGTGVASVVGGVSATGPATINGMAPGVYLGNYKIYGSPEVNDFTTDSVIIAALNDAINDGMDIVTLSSGGPALSGPLDSGSACGNSSGVPCDPLAQAFENAARAGLIIVVAAGNSGQDGKSYPTFNSISTPGDAPSVITVGASSNSHYFNSSGQEVLDSAQQNQLASLSSFGPSAGDSAIKPDLVAVGEGAGGNGRGVLMAASTIDPLGMLYSATGFVAADGTSFSTPMVAGAAAIVKQNHPGFTAAQVKSALVNTATQDVTTDDSGGDGTPHPVDVEWLGAGKLDVGAAVAATVTANPSTLSFGAITSGVLPLSKQLSITNNGVSSVTVSVAFASGSTGAGSLALSSRSLSIAPGANGSVTVTLSGTVPNAGEYSGAVTIQASGVSLRLPYMYLVGDGIAANITPLFGDRSTGTVGQIIPDGGLAFKLTDKFGLPVSGTPVSFRTQQGGILSNVSPATDRYGIAYATATLGSQPGSYGFIGSGGGLTYTFNDTARRVPTIFNGGVVNAGGFAPGAPVAPGSYVSIFGTSLSDGTASTPTANLPLALFSRNNVSGGPVNVSFDVPSAGLSLPGHLIYAGPGQVNVQVPWGLQGQTSVQVKVTIDFSYGTVLSVPLSNSAPGLYEFAPGVVAAQDATFNSIGTSNPAVRGQTIILYANGLGPVSNQPADGQVAVAAPLSRTNTNPTVMIGGVQGVVSFSGLAPGFPSLYQINVAVPPNANPGNDPISVSIGGQTSNTSSIVVQ